MEEIQCLRHGGSVRFTIPNPTFKSQTKTSLSLSPHKFGFKYCPSTTALKGFKLKGVLRAMSCLLKRGLSMDVDSQIAAASEAGTNRYSNVAGIPGYSPANYSKLKKQPKPCTLILCEGQSAKNMAVAIVSAIKGGKDTYGIFPLRGKVANIRKEPKYALTNKEYGYMKRILGLHDGTVYNQSNINTLPYRHILIMTDQDRDGGHIAGLLISIFDKQFPSLMVSNPHFLQRFITPIIKIKRKGLELKRFYSESEFNTWTKTPQSESLKPYVTKRYKGLGTSTREETIEYAGNLEEHVLQLVWDVESSPNAIELAFGKDTKSRRMYIEDETFDGNRVLDYALKVHRIHEFMLGEVWPYHWTSIQRGFPGFDGLKQSQRKIMFTFMEGREGGSSKIGSVIKGDIKVDQAASKVALHTDYSYGQQSLAAAMPLMAQNYIGRNNVALLVPVGQFSCRVSSHTDHAAPRYISTRCAKIARAFHPYEDDSVLLKSIEESGPKEPIAYSQVAPLILMNGVSLGIAAGYSCTLHPRNPDDVISAVKLWIGDHDDTCVEDLLLIDDDDLTSAMYQICDAGKSSWRAYIDAMPPWWRWFKGTVALESSEKRTYIQTGIWDICRDIPGKPSVIEIRITELPTSETTDAWISKIESKFLIRSKTSKVTSTVEGAFVRYIDNHSTDTDVNITVVCDKKLYDSYTGNISETMYLTKKMYWTDLVICDYARTFVFDKLSDFESFFVERYLTYALRVRHQLRSLDLLKNKARDKYLFVKAVVDGDLIVAKRPKADVIVDLITAGFRNDQEANANLTAGSLSGTGQTFTRLLGMSMVSMTKEHLEELAKTQRDIEHQIEALKKTTVFQLWQKDLDFLEKELKEYEIWVQDMWSKPRPKSLKSKRRIK